MKKKKLPEKFMGYMVQDLLRVWEETQAPEGTLAPMEMTRAMRQLIKADRLGLFEELQNGDYQSPLKDLGKSGRSNKQ